MMVMKSVFDISMESECCFVKYFQVITCFQSQFPKTGNKLSLVFYSIYKALIQQVMEDKEYI